ncbi:MAG: cytochrome-c peroxidase, partial [Bacteroidota bacterium]
ELFTMAYGDAVITEERMQLALAQFVRSIQSFDSKYDIGRAQVNGNNGNFPNFTQAENRGKRLFEGRAGCQRCHQAPEFSIDPNTLNNGVIGVAGQPAATDLTITRSPSLRDLVNPEGIPNGPMMHTGSFATLPSVIDHYDAIPGNNPNLDRRLRMGGQPQNLNLTDQEKADLITFLQTLTGQAIYTAEQWSDPF